MFSMYTEHGYLRARKRQEEYAKNINITAADKKQIDAFLRREERLQAYEFVQSMLDKKEVLTIEIETRLLFELCVEARKERLRFDDYIENRMKEYVDNLDNESDQLETE